MKRQLAALIVLATAFGTFQLPARADSDDFFGRHDRDHDGRWNQQEFSSANKYYYHHHPKVEYVNRKQWHNEFNHIDGDHDGYVNREDALKYRSWD